jgi:Phage integrase family
VLPAILLCSPDSCATRQRWPPGTSSSPYFQAHRTEQEQERASAHQIWHGEDWVFATPDGRPLNPSTDYHEWKRLLKEARLREARLHDARHTAATVLLVLRQPTPTVMSLMGWSSESMAARYQHVTDAMRSQVASQVGDLIWNPSAGPGDRAAVTVPSDSLVAVLAVAEKCIASHRGRARHSAEVMAAFAELRAALPDAAARSETANETRTETRRPTEG